ncbi:MAG: hypothetical protein IPI37_02660 [Bacteroidales bacterium]|nr:hypothetical protein [Bacteroidales bacterium]
MIHCTTAGTVWHYQRCRGNGNPWGRTGKCRAVASYIPMIVPEKVTPVAEGYRPGKQRRKTCSARYIREPLEGRKATYQRRWRHWGKDRGSRFFNPANLAFSPSNRLLPLH